MKLIIFDYENNEQYEFDSVNIKKINYYLENYKDIKLNSSDIEHLKWRHVILPLVISTLLTSIPFFITYGRNLSFNNDNLYKIEKLKIDNNEIESICKVLEEELGVTISDDEKDEYLLLDAINKNANLTDEEKEIYYQYIDIFLDNPYLNKEEVYHTLLNVDTLYKDIPNSLTKAIYEPGNKTIEIYENDKNKEYLKHEMVHSIFCHNNFWKLPNFFMEGMTEFITNEYFSANPYYEFSVYPLEISAIKMLCEVTSPDTVLKSFTYNDMNYIIDDMAKYIGKDASKEVIETLDFVFKQKESGKYNYEKEDIEMKCLSRLRECINKKYGDNELAKYSYYYNQTLFNSIFDKEASHFSYSVKLGEIPLDEKAYFSSKLKNNLKEEKEKTLVK